MSAVLEVLPRSLRALLVTITRAGFLFGRVGGGIVASRLIPGAGWQSIFIVRDIVKLLLGGVLTLCVAGVFGIPVRSFRRLDAVGAIVRQISPAAEGGVRVRPG